MNILQYPFITSYNNAVYNITYGSNHDHAIYSPLMQWLLNGKIAENPVITPSAEVQVVRPSSKNRFIESVTVEAIPTTTP